VQSATSRTPSYPHHTALAWTHASYQADKPLSLGLRRRIQAGGEERRLPKWSVRQVYWTPELWIEAGMKDREESDQLSEEWLQWLKFSAAVLSRRSTSAISSWRVGQHSAQWSALKRHREWVSRAGQNRRSVRDVSSVLSALPDRLQCKQPGLSNKIQNSN
jgi:hypothetical protein